MVIAIVLLMRDRGGPTSRVWAFMGIKMPAMAIPMATMTLRPVNIFFVGSIFHHMMKRVGPSARGKTRRPRARN
jgi:hypothetical protein